jgi:hypothetical protein
LGNSNYDFQGPPALRQRFESAVARSEYSPEAKAARNTAQRQWLGRQGYEEVDPVLGMTPSELRKMKAPDRISALTLRANNAVNKEKNSIERMQIEGTNQYNQGSLALNQAKENREGVVAGFDVAGKRLELGQRKKVQELMDQYNNPNIGAEDKKKLGQTLTAMGVLTPPKSNVEAIRLKGKTNADLTTDPDSIVFADKDNQTVKSADMGGEEHDFANPSQATLAFLEAMKTSNPKEYERMRKAFLGQQ